MPLITAANVRAEIQGLESADDTEIGLYLAQADELAARHLGFRPASPTGSASLTVSSYTEYLDGPDPWYSDEIKLRHRPVQAITSIHDDPDRQYGADTLVASTEYDDGIDLAAGRVRLNYDATHAWSESRRAIRVVYTAGWTDGSAPAGLRRALIEIVGSLWQRRYVQGLPNVTDLGRPMTARWDRGALLSDDLLTREARRALSPYRLMEHAVGG